ncbi:MAG: FAD-dependent oxidoreductase [Candidatus Scalindua sp.]|nr:FAD-dependent oxidoreductase [Candidatus Scalindua sp.]
MEYPCRKRDNGDGYSAFIKRRIKNALVVGGGFIALEMMESLIANGIRTHLIIRRDTILSQFDKDIALLIQNHIRTKGVQILEEDEIRRFESDGNGDVAMVITKKQTLQADFVLLATGISPNVQLAKSAGFKIGHTGGICVNQKQETNISDVYGVGDCTETIHLVTGKPIWFPLATTSNKQGRVAGINVAGANDQFPGIVGTFVVKVFDWTVAKTGLSEKEAVENGFETEAIIVPSYDNAHYFPEAKRIVIRLSQKKQVAVFLVLKLLVTVLSTKGSM